MNNKLLYYPYIDIPKSNWTVKSILYWDSVGIIVPPDYIEKPKQYGKFTIDLLKTDLIENVFPGEYIWKVKIFDESFIKLTDQTKFRIDNRKKAFSQGKVSRIHVQKFGEDLLNHLVDLKIAKRENWNWYYVESKTANLLMLYLATAISKVGGFNAATDKLKNLDTSLSQNGNSLILSSIRQNLLDELIPYPIEPNLTKLRKFKDKHHEELTSFRLLLEQITFDISLLNSKDNQDYKKNHKIAEINDKREKILSELNQSNFGQITFGTICGLTGAVIAFQQENHPLGFFSLANAIHSAFQGYDKSTTLKKDYSYLALIDRKFKHQKLI
jgi:hypothetical protein